MQAAKVLVLGTLGLAYPATRAAMEAAVAAAKEAGTLVFIDVNWRPVFWPDVEAAKGVSAEGGGVDCGLCVGMRLLLGMVGASELVGFSHVGSAALCAQLVGGKGGLLPARACPRGCVRTCTSTGDPGLL